MADLVKHVDTLGSKEYWRRYDSPAFVILFLPSEPLLSAALDERPDLLQRAFDKDVVLATPTTLLALLRTVAHTWRQESATRNAREVHDEVGAQQRAGVVAAAGLLLEVHVRQEAGRLDDPPQLHLAPLAADVGAAQRGGEPAGLLAHRRRAQRRGLDLAAEVGVRGDALALGPGEVDADVAQRLGDRGDEGVDGRALGGKGCAGGVVALRTCDGEGHGRPEGDADDQGNEQGKELGHAKTVPPTPDSAGCAMKGGPPPGDDGRRPRPVGAFVAQSATFPAFTVAGVAGSHGPRGAGGSAVKGHFAAIEATKAPFIINNSA